MNKARIAGIFYLLTIITGILSFVGDGRVRAAAGLIAAASYFAVTVLFYFLFKPANRHISLIAAVVSLAGLLAGPLGFTIANSLVCFGFYCLLIAYLIFRSPLLPRVLAGLMALAGLGWLIFLSPGLGRALYPYDLVPGIIGEGSLTLWLLMFGVDVPKWEAPAAAAAMSGQ